MLSYERGPLDIFLKIRESLGFEHSESGEPTAWPQGLLPSLLSCVWCLGGYSVVLMYGLWQLSEVVVMIFAAWTILIAIERWNHA